MKTIDFYFDLVSPYSYLAVKRFEADLGPWAANLVWRPIFLGGLFQSTNNQPPFLLPQRGQNNFRDVLRLSSYYKIPMQWPKPFPMNTMKAMRCLCALELNNTKPSDLALIAAQLFDAAFDKQQDLSQDEVLLQFVSPEVLAQTQSDEVKQKLKTNTETAKEAGAYGVPTFVVDGQMFYGQDRMFLLKAFLDGELAAV